MPRFLRLGTRFLFRALMPLLFFVGGAAMILWAQGWRLDLKDGVLVPTGVLSVTTTPPETRVFVAGKPLGVSPQIFLGIPVGKAFVCLQKTGYQSFCGEAEFTSQLAHRMRNIVLLPQFPRPRLIGQASEVIFDPAGRGFVRFYPDLSDALVFSGRSLRFLANTPFDPEAVIDRQGRLLSLLATPQPLFDDPPPAPNSGRFLENGYLFTSGNELNMHDGTTDSDRLLARFDEPIENAYFLPGSESMVVALPSSIHFIQRPGSIPHQLFAKDAGFVMRYFPASGSIVWRLGEGVYGYSFDRKNIL